jgi:surface polysaccharide O-acyltransferase-like enzyme
MESQPNESIYVRKKNRDVNFEILKILLAIGVTILHYCGAGMAVDNIPQINFWLLTFFKMAFIPVVDIFVIISGYFLSQSQSRSVWKGVSLLIEVFVLSLSIYLIKVVTGKIPFETGAFFSNFIPGYYFVVLYIALYLVSPFINYVLNKIKISSFTILLTISLLLFSIWTFAFDLIQEALQVRWLGVSTIGIDGSQYGYTFTNFVLLYLIGAYLRRKPIKTSTPLLLFFYLAILSILVIWKGFYPSSQVVEEYNSPLVIANGVLMFSIFAKFPKKENQVISFLAKGTFVTYVLQGFTITLSFLKIPEIVLDNSFVMVAHMLAVAFGIFLTAVLSDFVYHFVFDFFFVFLEKQVPIKKIVLPLSEQRPILEDDSNKECPPRKIINSEKEVFCFLPRRTKSVSLNYDVCQVFCPIAARASFASAHSLLNAIGAL